MREWADFTVQEAGGRTTVKVEGPLLVSTIGLLDRKLREYAEPVQTVDLSAIGDIDTVGAWTVWRFADEHKARITGANEQAGKLLRTVSENASTAPIEPERAPVLTRIAADFGENVIEFGHGVVRFIGFLGAVIAAAGALFVHPRRFRFKSLVRQFELVGVTAIPIIGLMSFLIGIVIAQQGAAQLRQFGAEIYTINLTGRLSLRELGVLMTAIMVAGRSGSAFAAQIGTMKLTEEIDAMRTIGVSPMEAIVLPRVAAATILMPLLGFYASICAIIGGGVFCWIGLEIPPLTYIQLLRDIIPMTDFWAMLIKAPVFGVLIGVTGCYEGMQVRQNAEEVGQRTTSAVVAAIFLVIVLDAFFAVFFSSIGWN